LFIFENGFHTLVKFYGISDKKVAGDEIVELNYFLNAIWFRIGAVKRVADMFK
jgi:hypothetical protein